MKLRNKIKGWFCKKSDQSYWQQAADDIILFRKGQLSREKLTERYPDLHCTEGWRRREEIKDAVNYTIPASCPLPDAARIIMNSKYEPFDKCLVGWKEIELSYCPEWEKLPQIGKLADICTNRKSVRFTVWEREGDYIDIRYCIRMGDRGDEDGYGVEPDTWLVARLNPDGSWLTPWYIEE